METYDFIQIAALFMIIGLLAKPLGTYMARVYQGEKNLLSPVLRPVERLIYRFTGVDPGQEAGWRQYVFSLLLFNLTGMLLVFLFLLFQGILPLNPQGFPGFSIPLAFNTAVSFMTNTDWQAYAGESAASYLTQTVPLTLSHFVAASMGMVIVISLIRGIVRRTAQKIGNFWVDLTRSILYILLPISLIAAVFLVSQGVLQNFSPFQESSLVQPVQTADGGAVKVQTLPMGPVASFESIKLLGTNGGGFFNANSAHPYENPTPLTNFIEIFLFLMIPFALTYTFGHMVGNARQGWAIFTAMMVILLASMGGMYWAEHAGNPLVHAQGIAGPNLEGKEVRFGLGGSILFAAGTTATSDGAVNSEHDSFTPLGGGATMFLILLGEVAPGGVGSGLYTMLAFVIIAVFVAGLMIGRTPEYLGKKIEVREMWLSVIIVLTSGVSVLIFSGIALRLSAGTGSIANPGPHGLSEVLYAFASGSNNNGSAFAGLAANTNFYNFTLGLAMLIGRFVPAVAALAMAGSLAAKKYVPPSLGTLPTNNMTFITWLIVVVLIVGALTFLPALGLGPIVEHLIMTGR
ncbi:MAG: potassium-transporting ATPase subunit KdpA [Actinobacteria bacterium]|nr:potassium-transporting ATPase subunit KdpA [Actinomycetota bacterium]MCL5882952.1 potassium-transporting ATPase subunit KdpA [Actinomycetota bacterium]